MIVATAAAVATRRCRSACNPPVASRNHRSPSGQRFLVSHREQTSGTQSPAATRHCSATPRYWSPRHPRPSEPTGWTIHSRRTPLCSWTTRDRSSRRFSARRACQLHSHAERGNESTSATQTKTLAAQSVPGFFGTAAYVENERLSGSRITVAHRILARRPARQLVNGVACRESPMRVVFSSRRECPTFPRPSQSFRACHTHSTSAVGRATPPTR